MQGGELTRSDGANVRRERALPHLECRDRGRSPYRPPEPVREMAGAEPVRGCGPGRGRGGGARRPAAQFRHSPSRPHDAGAPDGSDEPVPHADLPGILRDLSARVDGALSPPQPGPPKPCRSWTCSPPCGTSASGWTTWFRHRSRSTPKAGPNPYGWGRGGGARRLAGCGEHGASQVQAHQVHPKPGTGAVRPGWSRSWRSSTSLTR